MTTHDNSKIALQKARGRLERTIGTIYGDEDTDVHESPNRKRVTKVTDAFKK
jgi:hypothetical protein